MPQPYPSRSATASKAKLGVKFRCNSLQPSPTATSAIDPWNFRGRRTPFVEPKAATAGAATACSEGHRHRKVCLKLLARLASRLGLQQPCGAGEFKRVSTCRQLVSGSLLDVHLTWCRHLLEAYDSLRQDRDDLALRCAAQSRETAQLEVRCQQLDSQLGEAREQLERLQSAATAAWETLQIHHQLEPQLPSPQVQPTLAKQKVRPDTPALSPNCEDLLSPQSRQLAQRPRKTPLEHRLTPPGLQRAGSRQSLNSSSLGTNSFSAVSGRYHPPETGGLSRIPLPVWYKPASPGNSADAGHPNWPEQSPQHQQPLSDKARAEKDTATTRLSRATAVEALRRQRHRRSRTYDKPAPDLIDRWHHLTVDEEWED